MYPGSHQTGSYGNKEGILRSYSNGTSGKDFISKDETLILYCLKDEIYRGRFKLNMEHHQAVRFFRKIPPSSKQPGVKDLGLFRIDGFVFPEASMELSDPSGFGCDVNAGSPTHVKMVSVSVPSSVPSPDGDGDGDGDERGKKRVKVGKREKRKDGA